MSAANKIRRASLVELRRAARAKVGGGKRRLPRAPRLVWPGALERKYRKAMAKLVEAMAHLVERRLEVAYPQVVTSAQAARPTADHARADAYGDEIGKLMSLVRTGFFGEYTDAKLAELAAEIARAVATDNKRQLGGVFKSVLGVDVFQAEPWLNAEVGAFVTQNVGLIRSLSTSYFDRIERLVYDGARRGVSWQDLKADLRDATPATRARAELIARDQVGKFNGQLAELRQTQAGVDKYRWRTSLDERVRNSHAAREGKVFAWSDPPEDGHPGEPIQCRCYAEPVLEDLADGGQ